jgi:hypothetical protein
MRLHLEKNPSHKKKGAGGVAQGVGPEFKPQYRKQNKTTPPKKNPQKERM